MLKSVILKKDYSILQKSFYLYTKNYLFYHQNKFLNENTPTRFIEFVNAVVCIFYCFSSSYRTVESAPTLEGNQVLEELGLEELANLSVGDFLELTPKSIQEKTGHKLSIKETLALKSAQKKMKKAMKAADGSGPDEDDKILIYVLAFLIPPLAVFLCYEMEDNKFLVNLILTILCFLPGVIHALVVCSRYFNGR